MRPSPWKTLLLLATVAVAALAQSATISFPAMRTHGKGAGDGLHSGFTWESDRTALLIGDAWDRHWCGAATDRLAALVPKMNEVVIHLRKRGVLVINAPSDTMAFYEGAPARKRARDAPHAAASVAFDRWVVREPPEPELPLPEHDTGCDCEPKCVQKRAWTRQHPGIDIQDADAVTDSGQEVWNLLRARGVRHVVFLGVHANQGVLGRPFGIRNLVRLGLDVVFIGDLTDCMYTPRLRFRIPPDLVGYRESIVRPPFDRTPEVVNHICRHWCHVVTSEALLRELPPNLYRLCNFETDRPRVLFVAAEDEYGAAASLSRFALDTQRVHEWKSPVLVSESRSWIGGFQLLSENPRTRMVDLLVLFARRRTLSAADLEPLRIYLSRGGPLVALRTSSHAFENWKSFDREILGVRYEGHEDDPDGAEVRRAGESPLLAGVELPFRSAGTLYRSRDLAPECQVLLTGRTSRGAEEPVAWTRTVGTSRVFYTSLGHAQDFGNPSFRRLLMNAMLWALGEPREWRRN